MANDPKRVYYLGAGGNSPNVPRGSSRFLSRDLLQTARPQTLRHMLGGLRHGLVRTRMRAIMDPERIWREKSDEELVEAGEAIWEFTDEGERIVRSELRSRGLPEPPPPIDQCWKCGRAVHEGEPGDACSRCGEPFSASIRAKLEGPASAREADPADAEEPDFVYRSRYLHEVEMVCEHLEREGLAFYQSEEAMGVRYAMPAAPSVATLPGAWFLVIVPAAHAERAAEIVDALPISHGDDDERATGLAGV